MGLLEKAMQFKRQFDEEKKTAGLLTQASQQVEFPTQEEPGSGSEISHTVRAGQQHSGAVFGLESSGLLAKAGKYYTEIAREGLFDRAERFGADNVPRGVKVGTTGLLAKAILLIRETQVLSTTGRPPAGEEMPAAPAEVAARVEKKPSLPKTIPEKLKDYLLANEYLKLFNQFNQIIVRVGYEGFFEVVLQTFMLLGKGKSALLISYDGRRYREESATKGSENGAELKSVQKKGRVSFRKTSEFVEYISDNDEKLIKVGSLKDEQVLEEAAPLHTYRPWTIVPISLGEQLPAFIVIGNQPKRPGIKQENLQLFARMAAVHLVTYFIERNAGKRVDKLSDQKDELLTLLEVYDYSVLSNFSIAEILDNIAREFDIGAGIITTGWGKRDPIKVAAGTGISDEALSRYRISKSDREIKSIIRAGEPRVLEDIDSCLKKLPEEDRENANTAAVVPVQFRGETLGVLIIHKMKGVAKSLSARMKKKLRHIAQSLIPFLLYSKITDLDPFETFEILLEREAARARKSRSLLHVVAFKIKNFKVLIREMGFEGYRRLLDRFRKLVANRLGDRGVVYTVSLNKVVLLLVKKDADQAAAVVREIKSAVSELMPKEKGKPPMTLSPFRTSYPNKSKSVAEILQLIE
jgi:GGDEF domain-containing protein